MALRVCVTVTHLKELREWKDLDEDIRIFLAKAYKDKAFVKTKTDGISWISQLGFDKPGHPMGVSHDWICANKAMTMKASDQWFRKGLHQFGFPNYSRLYYYGLRTIGIPYRLGGRLWKYIKSRFPNRKSGS